MHLTSCIFWTLPRCPGDDYDYAPWCTWWQGPEWLSHPHPVLLISQLESGSVFLFWALLPWEGDWCLRLARTARKLWATSAWIGAIPAASDSEKRNCVYRGSIVCTLEYSIDPHLTQCADPIRNSQNSKGSQSQNMSFTFAWTCKTKYEEQKQIPMATNSFPGFLQHVFLHIELTVVKFQILTQRKASPECPQACCL